MYLIRYALLVVAYIQDNTMSQPITIKQLIYAQPTTPCENVYLTFGLWGAFSPEVEFQNEVYGRKALYQLYILVFVWSESAQ